MDKSLKQYQSKFRYKFDMDSKAIDLREMCKNFPSVDDRNGFIPLEKINEAIETIKFFKRKFSKDRPYEAARKLGMPELDRLPSKTNKTRSYPSGHSTQGYLAGLYVANKYPDYSDGIMTAGLECGIGRIKAGFHYLDDHHGGIHLAQQIFRLIKK